MDSKYPTTWKWDDHGATIEGVLTGLRFAKSKFADEPVPVITLTANGTEFSVWLPGGLLRQMSDAAPKYGDTLRITRGDLVPFGNEGRTYRAWDVVCVRKEGEYADLSGPGLPEVREPVPVQDSDIPF